MRLMIKLLIKSKPKKNILSSINQKNYFKEEVYAYIKNFISNYKKILYIEKLKLNSLKREIE